VRRVLVLALAVLIVQFALDTALLAAKDAGCKRNEHRGCSTPKPSPTPTPEPSSTPTPSPTPAPEPSPTPTREPSPTPSPSPPPASCAGELLDHSMSEAQVEAALDAGALTATFCFAPGTYRMSLTPKKGQTLVGERGAVLKGTRVATGWVRQANGIWALANATFDPVVFSPPFAGNTRSCEATPANCHYADLFENGIRLTRVLDDTTPPPGAWHWDYAENRVYVNTSDPRAAVMELTDRNTGILSAGNLTVRGLTLTHYGRFGIETSAGDLLRDVTFAWNHGYGFRLGGNPATIIGGHAHHNGQFGGFCAGANKTIDGLEFSYNNNLHFATAQGGYWGAGAIKCVQTTNLVVRNVYSHDNYSDGFWTDINNRDVVYENNRMVRNARFGIFHEISCSVEIRGNTLRDNGNDGLFIHSSIDANVLSNTFGGNGDAAVEIKDNLLRTATPCASSPGASGNRVHDNTLNGDAVTGCVAPRNDCWGNV
jgi:parallel beta-helix repeat protein